MIYPLFYTPGQVELIIITILIILLFGADKIPELARESGRAIQEFQNARMRETDEEND